MTKEKKQGNEKTALLNKICSDPMKKDKNLEKQNLMKEESPCNKKEERKDQSVA